VSGTPSAIHDHWGNLGRSAEGFDPRRSTTSRANSCSKVSAQSASASSFRSDTPPFGLTEGGGFWGAIGGITENFGILGYVFIGIFLLSWLGSVAFQKLKRYDDREVVTVEGV